MSNAVVDFLDAGCFQSKYRGAEIFYFFGIAEFSFNRPPLKCDAEFYKFFLIQKVKNFTAARTS